MLTFHVLSIFPESVENYCGFSILKRAQEKKLVDFKFYNLRDYTNDKHGKVDDKPYGGGPGMVMTIQPIVDCVKKIKENLNTKKTKIILFKPGGEKFTNIIARKHSIKFSDIILICGRYEGIDARVEKILKPEIISIGDYVLTGGEIPAMVYIDCITRQIKGVLGDNESLEENRDSHDEFFTRPEIYEYKNKSKTTKLKVPSEFLSGDSKKIKQWKEKQRIIIKDKNEKRGII